VNALAVINDKAAVQPLIAAMNDPDADVRHCAVNALTRCDHPAAIDVLLAALRCQNLEVVAESYHFLIKRGEPDSEDLLIGALHKTASKHMAAAFLNSGNRKLKQAAQDWAGVNGYRITGSPGGRYPGWGSNAAETGTRNR